MSCWKNSLVTAVIIACAGLAACEKSDVPKRPSIKKLGTIDCDMVETTPIVFHGRLYRFESVRTNYKTNKTGNSYFRFTDTVTGVSTPSFAVGMHLGCALVESNTVYVYGAKGERASTIYVFWSKDLKTWSSQIALDLSGWEIFNTSVCKANGRYVMAFECGSPPEVVGVAFTNRFAESTDLRTWRLLPEPCVFSKDRYTACPTIRFLKGYFYMIYLEARPGPTCEPHIVRSKDLSHWESSPLNPVMRFSPEDKIIANPKLTAEECQRIATAANINNSDVDFCEYGGKVVIYYSWGNQQGIEHLAEAVYDGTLKDFLLDFFPKRVQ